MDSILEYCKGLHVKSYNSGEVLLNEGDTSGKLLVLIEGEVEVVKGSHIINNVSEPGAIFGEISVPFHLPHMATVTTVKTSKFYELMCFPNAVKSLVYFSGSPSKISNP